MKPVKVAPGVFQKGRWHYLVVVDIDAAAQDWRDSVAIDFNQGR